MTSPSREAFEAALTRAIEEQQDPRFYSTIDAINWAWQAAIQHARDVAARVCNGEMVEEIQPVDHCYNNACVRCADAIKEALK